MISRFWCVWALTLLSVSPSVAAAYHAGLLWVLFLFLWWVTFPQPRVNRDPLPETGLLHKALILVVTLCVCIHLVWAGQAIRYDAVKAYSPNHDGAILLQQYLHQGQKAEIAIPSKLEGDGNGQYYITGLEPYFAVEPIGNMPLRFWFWGWGEDMRPKYLLDSQNQSVIVIVEETEDDPPLQDRGETPGAHWLCPRQGRLWADILPGYTQQSVMSCLLCAAKSPGIPFMKISVVIPVFNSSRLLNETLHAISSGSRATHELIVVDDRSMDDSAAIAEQFGAHVIVMPENVGPAACRNQAALFAKGDILVFLDADTCVHSDTWNGYINIS